MAARKTKTVSSKKTTTSKTKNDSKVETKELRENQESIVIQVDNETQMLIQQIKTSISSEIIDKLNSIEESIGGSSNNEELKAELKKITKRIDGIEGTLDEMVSSINKIKLQIDLMNRNGE